MDRHTHMCVHMYAHTKIHTHMPEHIHLDFCFISHCQGPNLNFELLRKHSYAKPRPQTFI